MDTRDKKNNNVILIGVALIAMVFIFTFFRSGFGSKNNSSNEVIQKKLDYPKISSEDLKNKLKTNEDLRILDIRTPDDFAMEHLVNSLNTTSEEIINAIPKEKTIIIVGYSAKDEEYTKIIDYLKEKKYDKFFILTGGFDLWKQTGGSVISIGNPTSFPDAAKITYIIPEDFKKIVENRNYPKYIIDIRSKQSFDSGHIPGAKNILLDDLEKSASKIPYGKEIYVYGDTDLPGFQGGVRLYDLNFMTTKVLQGGLEAWKSKGFTLEK